MRITMRRVKKFPVFILMLIVTISIVGVIFLLNRTYTIHDFYDIDTVNITSVKVVSGENGRIMTLDESEYIEEYKAYLSQVEFKRKYFAKKTGWLYDFSPYEGDACGFEIIFYSDSLCKIGDKMYKIIPESDSAYALMIEDLAELNLDVTFEYEDGEWDSINLEKADFHSREEFEKAAKEYLFTEMKLLNRNQWYRKYGENVDTLNLKITFTTGNFNNEADILRYDDYTISASIIFDKVAFEVGRDPLAYELAHLIVKPGSYSLTEGIAEYFQDTIQKNTASLSYGIDINDFAINMFEYARKSAGSNEEKYLNMIESIFASVGKTGDSYPADVALDNQDMWHTLNYFYVNFLIERYGMEQTAQLCQSSDLTAAYLKLESGGIETVKAIWIGFINSYNAKIPYEKMIAMIQAIPKK